MYVSCLAEAAERPAMQGRKGMDELIPVRPAWGLQVAEK